MSINAGVKVFYKGKSQLSKGRMEIKNIKFCFSIGFAYWRDIYTLTGLGGNIHHIILPFVRIEIGYLDYDKNY